MTNIRLVVFIDASLDPLSSVVVTKNMTVQAALPRKLHLKGLALKRPDSRETTKTSSRLVVQQELQKSSGLKSFSSDLYDEETAFDLANILSKVFSLITRACYVSAS